MSSDKLDLAFDAHHAADMDAMYRGQRHIYDLTRKYYLLGRDRLIAELRPPAGGSVLEVGCGTGRNLVAAAKRYRDVRHYGFDISNQMLISARRAVSRAGLVSQVHLVQADATRFTTLDIANHAGFDRIFCSYAVSMIPGWQQALSQAVASLNPGGSLHIVDFGDQDGLPRFFRRILFNWLARFQVTPRLNLHQIGEQLAMQHGLRLDYRQLYRGYAQMLVLERPYRCAS